MTETTEATSWRRVGPLRPGDPRHVGGFDVVGRLGEGGMGVVYLAEHPEKGRAALKFVRTGGPDDDAFRARFRREIAAAERVDSPRVAPVLGADPDADVPWLATAFVDGPTLREAVAEDGPMSGERLVALAVSLADALTAVHAVDVVHRDLKPSNILLTPDTPVVIDFGIAALREAPALTRTGAALGTPGWMAPEQVQGHPSSPATDVFGWGLVVAFAASGESPFGSGPADALFYRVVHEPPDLPALPDPLDMLVPAALTKDPVHRPDLGVVLARLTGQPEEPTALGPTLADRTAIVPTVVALGWDVEALPSRPDGRARAVPTGASTPTGAAPASDAAAFWYAGEDHGSLRSLAGAFQVHWEDAREQIFGSRNPIWVGELRGFLRAQGALEADRIVAEGAGDAPPAAALARLLVAMDPNLDPRVGSIVLTPEGLTAAAEAVTGGGLVARVASLGAGQGERVSRHERARTAERLAEIASARVLRLWRSLPGMERAAAIDERWHASTEAFGRFVTQVAPHAGWPSPDESQRAAATLLLCAVDPQHERQLERRLTHARRTAATRQTWWAQLAAEGQHNPPAAMLAVLTSDRARSASVGARQASRAADRQKREAERRRYEAEREHERERRAAEAAVQPRFVPIPRAQTSVRGGWALALTLAGLVAFLWADGTFTEDLLTYVETTGSVGPGGSFERVQDASNATVWAVLLLVALPVMHVVTRVLVGQGTSRGRVRVYAGAAAAVDLLLALVLMAAATLAGLVVGAVADARIDPDVGEPFVGESWGVVAVLLPYGVWGVVLAVRSVWRLGRVVFGRPLAGPFFGRSAYGYPVA